LAIGDDNIRIGVSPDLSGFNRELEAKLRALSSFDIAINGKPVLTGFKSELDRELAKVEKTRSAEVKITPTVNKAEINKFKSELNRQLGQGGKSAVTLNVTKSATTALRRQIQKDVFDKPFTVKAEMTKTSLKALQKSLQIPLELKLPSQAEINLLRGRIQQRFGAIRVQVNATSGPVANVGSGISKGATQEVEKFSYATRNLARDMTLVGRAATQNKASLFSFLGAISPGQVALTALSTGLISGTRAFIKFGLESSKAIQQTQLALNGFLGNNRPVVDAFIKQMQNFAAVSPFNLENILKTSKLLLGAGQNVTKILPELRAIGGVGAQLGVSSEAISRVGTAIAKIAGQGKVTSRELRSIFTAFPGFQPIQALANNLEGFGAVYDKTGKLLQGGSTTKVLKAMSKGAIDANSAIDALIKGMEQFPGAAEALYKQSLLLAGSQETLKDRFEQVARAAVDKSLPQLAYNYREAAEIFNKQSETNIGGGIRSLIRNGSDLIPIFAKGVVPIIDKFAGALASLIPPFKQFFSDFGPAFFESFTALLKLAPAFADNLTLIFTVMKPFAPLIETFAKALNLIPAPVITTIAALRLLGSVRGGLSGGLFSKRALVEMEDGTQKWKQVPTVLGKARDSITGTTKQIKSDFQSAGNVITNAAGKSMKAVQSFGDKVNAKAYTKYVDDTIAAETKRINKLVTGDQVEQRMLADRGKNYARFISGPGGVEDLNKRAEIYTMDKSGVISRNFAATQGGLDSVRKSLAGVSQETIPFRDKFTAATSLVGSSITLVGSSITSHIGGALSGIKNSIKGAASGLSTAFGGPLNLLITGLAVGAGALFENYQKAKAEAAQVKKETQLIGKELALDGSARDGAEQLASIMHKLATETEVAAAAISKLEAGFKGVSTAGLSGDLLKNITDIKNGISETDLGNLISSGSALKQTQAELKRQAGDLSGTGFSGGVTSAFNRAASSIPGIGGLFSTGNKDSEKALTATQKTYSEYIASAKETVNEEIKSAKNLGAKGLVSKFKQAKKDLDGGADPTVVYESIKHEVSQLATANANLDSSAVKAALSGYKLTKQMQGSSQAMAAVDEATTELNASLNELILNQDNISADNVLKSITPKELGGAVKEFQSLANDPNGQQAYLKRLSEQFTATTGDPAEAQKILKQITGFKNIALTEMNAMKDELIAALPTLASVFEEGFTADNGGLHLSQIKKNIVAQTKQIKTFADNLNYLTSKGFGDLAITLAKQGPEKAGRALQEAADYARQGNTKALDQFKQSQTDLENSVTTFADGLDPALRAAFKDKYGVDIDLQPNYGLFVDPAEEKRVSDEIVASNKRIAELVAVQESINAGKGGAVKDAAGNYIPVAAGTSLDDQISNEKKRLEGYQAELKKITEGAFTDLNAQSATSATTIAKTIGDADISGSLQPEIDKTKAQIATIATGADSLGAQIASNFAPSLTGSKIGGKSVVFKGNSSFDIEAIIGDVLNESAKSTGTKAGEAMAKAFKDSFKVGAQITEGEAKVLSTGILKPFRTARTGINSLITALTAMGTSLGVPITISQIPEFHTGGIVGSRGAKMHSGSVKDKEQLAVLLKGEAVLPHKTVNQMSPEMIKSLVKGDVDGFIPQYLKSKAIGGTRTNPSAEAASSFQSDTWISQFDSIRRSIDAQMAQTKHQLVKLAFETFDAAHGMSSKYAKSFDSKGEFGSIASVASLTGSLKEIAAQMAAVQGKDNNYKTLIAYMKSTGVPFDVSSTVRPGAITNSGGRSYHGFGRAVDFVGKKYGNDTKELGDIFKAFNPVESLLAELIYAGPQAKYNVKNGKRVGKYAVADHHNHVHAALYNGGLVKGSADGIIANIGERGQSEVVLPMNNPARIMDLTTQAIRTQMLGVEGQQAMLMALVGAQASQPKNVHHGNNTNVGDIIVKVESPSSDPTIQAEIIAMRVRSALRRL
jgi:tape measure domain-containing protein